ncbi:hypothetical protein [Paenibacillus kobensis]|uniref:hypothetical protein n=1 Tax=Paenibacillus kobensis TaxID=59841 RepID=UPI000FDB6469|nr:hypothetical protein [Paenibacillus kobensis]
MKNKKMSLLYLVLAVFILIPALAFASPESNKSNGKVKTKLPKGVEVWEQYGVDKEFFKADVELDAPPVEQQSNKSGKKYYDLEGFSGYYATDEVAGDRLVIVEESLNISQSGLWEAKGLIRNEYTSPVKAGHIEADLINKNGEIIKKVKGESMVELIRPGEPVPFVIQTDIDASLVANVEWSIKSTDKKQDFNRQGTAMVLHELPYGEETYNGELRSDAPFPYKMSVQLRNLSKKDWNSAYLVVAWIDSEGKVFNTIKVDSDKTYHIYADGVAMFDEIVVDDPSIAPYLSQYEYMTWVVGK